MTIQNDGITERAREIQAAERRGFAAAYVPAKPSAARRYRVEVYVEDPMEVDETVQVEATEETP